jgi:signal transduction histidine kinase
MYAAIFMVSVLVLFGILYWATIGSVSRQIDATIQSEILGLAEQYERGGLNGLADVLNERVARTTDYHAIYLFVDSRLVPVAGNLRKWPSAKPDADSQIEFDTVIRDDDTRRYRASILSVGRTYRLLVGRDVHELTQISTVFRRAAFWGIAVMFLLSVAGGAFVSLSAQRRIALINRTARRIIGGDLSERVPITGGRDEYDDLAVNINEMLSQIEILLANVRHVGDSVAHDLKTPLTRLRNRLESLSHSDASMSAELQRCIDESDHLLATFNALLRIARIESGAYRTGFSTFEIMDIVSGVCDLYHAAAEEKDIALTVTRNSPAQIYGDRELLTQALANLLDNAVKYTPRGGKVSIDVIEQKNDLVLAVSDTGPGVPADDHLRIQQRFIRLDEARSAPGNGLGLALVKAVADQHGGQLRIEDLDPGLRVAIVVPRKIAGE